MLRRLFNSFFSLINRTLEKPQRVLFYCVFMAFMSLIFDGSLMHIWSMSREKQKILRNTEMLKAQIQILDRKIAQAKKPEFIQQEAIRKFNLVEDGDLVFIITDAE